MYSKLKTDGPRREQSCIQYPKHFLQMLLISFASGNMSRLFPEKPGWALCEKVVSSAKIETWQMRALWCAFILI